MLHKRFCARPRIGAAVVLAWRRVSSSGKSRQMEGVRLLMAQTWPREALNSAFN
jgi:hypothetical protein